MVGLVLLTLFFITFVSVVVLHKRSGMSYSLLFKMYRLDDNDNIHLYCLTPRS